MSFLKRHRGSFQPICNEERMSAYYLGKLPARGKVGLSVVQGPVASLYQKFRDNVCKRVLLEVTSEGLWVKQTGEGSGGRLVRRHTVGIGSNVANEVNIISTGDISFGAVDANVRKVFAIIVRSPEPDADYPWECHAFLCNTHSDAKRLTLNLVSSFQKLAQSKGIHVGTPGGPNTMHVFTESSSAEYLKSGTSVTTLKITFNVEQIETNWSESNEYNKNRYISTILAKTDENEINNKSLSNPPSGSSDNENESSSDPEILEEVSRQNKSRQSLVAVNTGLTPLTAVSEVITGSDEENTDSSTSKTKTGSRSPSKLKLRKKKTVRFTAEINYIE